MLNLRIQQFDRFCLFELSWGQGQRLSKTHAYPDTLTLLYQVWQQAYLNYYRHAPIPVAAQPSASLRGQKAGSGAISSSPQVDWHGAVVEAETLLLREFHRWLRDQELYEIRARIAETSPEGDQPINLFLSCTPIELARLPWETWEIGAEFRAGQRVRMIRTPTNVRGEPAPHAKRLRSRPRILAILGDSTGLDFKADKAAIKSVERLADVEFVGWQPGKSIEALRAEIGQAIADPQGWDLLFFAGHSNETQLTGGELGIAPNATIRISELEPKLLIAKERGLQFALFNSCKGLSLAESLIDLGLSQVAVMREPIDDRVAHIFLTQFMRALAQHQDVHAALLAGCQFLKAEANLTYPSAYLIPSLFCHPQVELYRIPLPARQRWFRHWRPKRYEAIALAGLTALSWLLPVQQKLLDQRVMIQARLYPYEAAAQQSSFPPVLLVSVDDESINAAIREAGISGRNPIPQGYLAKVIQRLGTLNVKLIGVDYLLDNLQPTTLQLRKTIDQMGQKGTRFVFAMTPANESSDAWLKTLPEIAEPKISIHADAIRFLGEMYFVPLFWQPEQPLPFSCWLAWFHRHCVVQNSPLCQEKDPQSLAVRARAEADAQIPLSNRLWITALAHWLGQRWLHPISDFSIPPQKVYTMISAQQLLNLPMDAPELKHITQQTVMIVPAYPETGIPIGSELFKPPESIRYWYGREDLQSINQYMISGEHHAYLFYYFLNRRFVLPIPDLWMVLLAALVGKVTVLLITRQSLQNRLSSDFAQSKIQQWRGFLLLAAGTGGYVMLSLGLYASPAAILLPIMFPVVTFWVYVLPVVRKDLLHER